MVVRTKATVCSREITRANSRGAEPKMSAVSRGASCGSATHSKNAEMPAWATSPTQARSSADSCRYQGYADSIRIVASVASSPLAAVSRWAKRRFGAGSVARSADIHAHEAADDVRDGSSPGTPQDLPGGAEHDAASGQ